MHSVLLHALVVHVCVCVCVCVCVMCREDSSDECT